LTPIEVRKLISVVEHGKTRDIAIYALASNKLDGLQAQIEALHEQKHQLGLSRGSDLNALDRWQRWAESEIGKLQYHHQAALGEKEAARLVAVKSTAKVLALEILLNKAVKNDIMVKRRRAEQNGLPPDA